MAPKVIHKVGFLGAGVMGAPMAKRLLTARFVVQVWNRSPAKVAPLLALGAQHAETPAQAANGVDALLVCLSDAAAVEAVLFGSDGVVQSPVPPPLLVDFSTIGPVATRALARRLREHRGTSWVDAPVSGGAAGAQQGKLVIFCGGSEHDIERLAPIFSALSQRTARMGELGAGQTLKLCNQLIVAANLVAIAESLALAHASGLAIETLPGALAGGFADSLPLQVFGQRMASGITMPIIGELGLMLKDLRAVHALAEDTKCRLPLVNAALEVYDEAEDRGLSGKDLATLLSLHEPTDRAFHAGIK